MSIEYKELLKKYIQHVADCEGITFIDRLNEYMTDVKFTDEEAEELRRLESDKE